MLEKILIVMSLVLIVSPLIALLLIVFSKQSRYNRTFIDETVKPNCKTCEINDKCKYKEPFERPKSLIHPPPGRNIIEGKMPREPII